MVHPGHGDVHRLRYHGGAQRLWHLRHPYERRVRVEPDDYLGSGRRWLAGQRDYPAVSWAFFRSFQRSQSNLGQPGSRRRVHCGAEPHLSHPFPRLPVRLRSVNRVERGINRHLAAVAGPMVPAKAHHDDGVHRRRIVGRRADLGPLLGLSVRPDRLADYLGRFGRDRAGFRHPIGLHPAAERTRGNGSRTRRRSQSAATPATPPWSARADCSKWTTGGTHSARRPCGSFRRLTPYAE